MNAFPSVAISTNEIKPKIYWCSRRQRGALKSACWRGRDERARTHRSKTVRPDCAQCTFHTPTCLVEACSCHRNHQQSRQQAGWGSHRRCKRRSAVWTWGQTFSVQNNQYKHGGGLPTIRLCVPWIESKSANAARPVGCILGLRAEQSLKFNDTTPNKFEKETKQHQPSCSKREAA